MPPNDDAERGILTAQAVESLAHGFAVVDGYAVVGAPSVYLGVEPSAFGELRQHGRPDGSRQNAVHGPQQTLPARLAHNGVGRYALVRPAKHTDRHTVALFALKLVPAANAASNDVALGRPRRETNWRAEVVVEVVGQTPGHLDQHHGVGLATIVLRYVFGGRFHQFFLGNIFGLRIPQIY